MSWREFIASIVSSLVWPAMIIVLVVVLRKPLAKLIPLLQKLKYKDLELDFGKQAKELGEELAVELPDANRGALPEARAGVAERIARESPRAAVIEAWREVELAAVSAARRLGGDFAGEKPLSSQGIRYLESSNQVDRGIVSLLRDLRGLRNQAAHAPEFALSTESALEYADAATRVGAYLNAVGDAPNNGIQTDNPAGCR